MIDKSMLAAASSSTLFFVSFSQFAAARDFADIYTECGLGALIAPKNGAVAAQQRAEPIHSAR